MKGSYYVVGAVLVLVLIGCGTTEEQYYNSNGARLSFKITGEGPPVVLLHGFSHSREEDWIVSGVYGKLSQDYQVIALDARGHGKSDKPHAPDSYGIKMVEDIVHLLDHLEIEKAHIAGYSMGGFMALKMATLYPERISSLILGGASWIDAQWDELGPAWEVQASEFEAGVREVGDNDPLALAAVLKKEYELKISEEELSGCCSMPSLAIMGELDFLRPGLDSLSEVVPTLQVEILEGEDHGTTYSAPEFASLIQSFLANVSARQP